MRPVQQPQSQGQTQSGVGCGDIVRSVGRDGLLKAGSTPGHCHIHIAANNGNQAISRHIIVDKVALLVTGPHREGDTVVCFFFIFSNYIYLGGGGGGYKFALLYLRDGDAMV